jgi:ATPase subunit of ABC transporter with duplicated ATPase domains
MLYNTEPTAKPSTSSSTGSSASSVLVPTAYGADELQYEEKRAALYIKRAAATSQQEQLLKQQQQQLQQQQQQQKAAQAAAELKQQQQQQCEERLAAQADAVAAAASDALAKVSDYCIMCWLYRQTSFHQRVCGACQDSATDSVSVALDRCQRAAACGVNVLACTVLAQFLALCMLVYL